MKRKRSIAKPIHNLALIPALVATVAFLILIAPPPAAGAASAKDIGALEKSAMAGDPSAQFELGKHYRQKKDEDRALKWFQKAAAQGHVEAQYEFANALTNDTPVALFLMGMMYKDGDGVEKDRGQAINWLKKAAACGHVKAADFLAKEFGIKVKVTSAKITDSDKKNAPPSGGESKELKAISKAAFAGDATAQFELAKHYQTGDGVEKNEALALRWFQRAARQGNVEAQYIFARALKEENPEALFLMGLMYRTGDGVTKDIPEAVKWLQKAAKKGHLEAQYTLGAMYENGDGVEKDRARASKWLKMAAEKGHDEAGAALLFLEAENGDADAACKLAQNFELGRGVGKSMSKAFE